MDKNKVALQEAVSVATPVSAITGCRVCKSESLTTVLSLGDHYVSDFMDTPSPAARASLDLVLCDASEGGCGLLQLRHTVEQQSLYRNYWYRSGLNETMKNALSDIVRRATEMVPLAAGAVVIDTGSNDNTLLKAYPEADIVRIGFEPATNVLQYAQDKDITVLNDFFSAAPFFNVSGGKRAKIITSIAMFYDLDDPNIFTRDIAQSLAPEGLWIIQMAYLPVMLAHNIFDNICHEHLEYYSLLSLEALLDRHNLKAIDVELNTVNGGSYRIYITHTDNQAIEPFKGAAERLTTLRAQEKTLKLDEVTPYKAFAERVAGIREQVTSFIHQQVAEGKTVYVYGASTKGNTLLQYFGLDNTVIVAAAERNPDKWGKKTVGTWIPIISEAEARAQKPDYFLVLPWHFLPEFQEREKEYLTSGGKFIIPLPEFNIIGG